ncbi:MAG: cell division protein ZapE [Pseudomonadota bacterium]
MDTTTLSERYLAALEANGWARDCAQWAAVQSLARVARELNAKSRPRWRFWEGEPSVKGLYLWGSVGRGKTFLMDLFVSTFDASVVERKHFHRFMSEIHEALGAIEHEQDPLDSVAKAIANESRVLCLDEMHVNDIGDAMILGRLFEKLFAQNMTLITTSNIPPSGLYEDGLQRARFLPAIALMETHCEVLELGGNRDYRLELLSTGETYHVCKEGCEAWAAARLKQLAGTAQIGDLSISVLNRDIALLGRAPGMAWFSFPAICETARSQLDYISLSKRLHTVLISSVPILDDTDNNAARRFIMLVDEFYDRQVNLLLCAQVPANQLYTGKKLAFEFQRTVSRLIEMQSSEYHALAHRP